MIIYRLKAFITPSQSSGAEEHLHWSCKHHALYQVCMYGMFMSFYSSLMHTYGMAQVTELRQWHTITHSCSADIWTVLHRCGTSLVGGRAPTWDSAHSWWLSSAASLQTMLLSPWPAIPLSHIILMLSQTSPCPILIMPRSRLGEE